MIATFAGEWTWHDFQREMSAMHQAVGNQGTPVDLLLWHTSRHPSGNPLMQFNEAIRSQPANVGRVIVLHTNDGGSLILSVMKSLSNIVKRINPTRTSVTIVSTQKEAEALLGRPIRLPARLSQPDIPTDSPSWTER